jgi:ketopantoate hydroxymethyltransferase
VKFLIEKSTEHHVLDFVVNAADHLGLTPLYHVCQRGYQKKAKKDETQKEHLDRKDII